ncbi:hypothetical protein HHI36_008807, partial [Cryptolaemus montrouzieri]
EKEEFDREHNNCNVHKKVRAVVGLYNKKITDTMVDFTGKTTIDEQDIFET